MNQETILLIAALLTALLGLVIGTVAFSYRQLIKKYYHLKEEEDQRLHQARQAAQTIIAEANQKAQVMLAETGHFSDQLREDFVQEITHAKKIQDQHYQKLLQAIQSEVNNLMQSISKEVTSQTSGQVETFMTSLQKQILSSQESVMAALKQDYQKVQTELKDYQQQMQKRLDHSVYQILASVASRVLGKTINLEEHEELVLDALNQAKREHLF